MKGADDTGRKRPKSRRLIILLIYGSFLIVLMEITSYVAGRILQSKWGMYRDPAPVAGKHALPYDEYLRIRDPILGWPRSSEFGDAYDSNGAWWCRESGADDAKRWALSLYGDSFTADAVGDDTDSWGCRIQRLTGAKVRNYGVGGYGTDQALIRYLENKEDEAELVILGHMSADIVRNVTRYRDFEVYTRDLAFKPRYVIGEDGKLELVPIPALSHDEYRRFLALESPQLFLPHEFLHPNGPSGAVRLTFPFTLALVRNFGFEGFRVRLAGISRHALYYAPDHPSDGLRITTEIMLEFVRVAKQRGQAALLVIFPARSDLDDFLETDRWCYQELIDRLQKRAARPLNFGEFLLAHFKGSLDEAFGTGSDGSRHHYSIQGSHLVADTVLRHLNETRLLSLPLKKK